MLLACEPTDELGVDASPDHMEWQPTETIMVASALPAPPIVEIVDDSRPGGTGLFCKVSGNDADQDALVFAFTWAVDGQPVTSTGTTNHPGDTVPLAVVQDGTWRCVVIADDGEAASEPTEATASVTLDRNVLVLVADDLSVNFVGAYGYGTGSITANIDALAADGLLFRNGYANPRCTGTRATTLSGRFVRRSGMARLDGEVPWALPLEEVTIPEMLDTSPWHFSTAAIGKWHLSMFSMEFDHALRQGFDTHVGVWQGIKDYYDWPRIVDGEDAIVSGYATTVQVDDALDQMQLLSEPWFIWLAFNAPHRPFHVPPDELHTQNIDEDSPASDLYRAAVEALDTEIGRLLNEMDQGLRARTTIVFVSDNGTMDEAIDHPIVPEGRAKATLYEQGTRVPFIVSGPLLAEAGESDVLVHTIDLFPTIAEIAGVDVSNDPIDGVSFLDVLVEPSTPRKRDTLVIEDHRPSGPPPWNRHWMTIRGPRYKLFWDKPKDIEEFYDLGTREFDDGPDLLLGTLTTDEQAAYDALRQELDDVDASIAFEY